MQRLAIAQEIMEDPAVLILDEPMNGLDRQGVEEMRQIFCKEKQKGKTILLASHNREDIEALCDHVYRNGKAEKLILSSAILLLLTAAFFTFTEYPPQLGIFQ